MTVNVAQIGAGALTVSGGTIVGTTVTTAQYQSLQFVYASTGTTWYSVAPPSTAPGLAIITPTSIANSGGSASASGGAVTFSAVNSISLNGVFTSTYENYRVIISSVASVGGDGSFRFRAAGSDLTTSTYNRTMIYGQSGVTVSNQAGAAFLNLSDMTTSTSLFTLDINGANLAARKTISGLGYTSSPFTQIYGAANTTATAMDGFTFYPASGTVTGTIRVYGYKNS
jgi:hypothetical protein